MSELESVYDSAQKALAGQTPSKKTERLIEKWRSTKPATREEVSFHMQEIRRKLAAWNAPDSNLPF